jgi:hypothetical protein
VADVDDLRLGSNLQHHALYGADEMIANAKVGRKSNDWNAWQPVASFGPEISGVVAVSNAIGVDVKVICAAMDRAEL